MRHEGEKKKARLSEVKCTEEVDCEAKGDTKESELLMQPLGELHSIIYNRDGRKID